MVIDQVIETQVVEAVLVYHRLYQSLAVGTVQSVSNLDEARASNAAAIARVKAKKSAKQEASYRAGDAAYAKWEKQQQNKERQRSRAQISTPQGW